MSSAILILGNQLFPVSFIKEIPSQKVFMAEDWELCTHYKYHKKKLLFFLMSMRNYADELKSKGFDVSYHQLNTQNKKSNTFTKRLQNFIQANKIKKLHFFEIEDKFFEKKIKNLIKELKIESSEHQSPNFLFSRKEFKDYLKDHKPLMKSFYEKMRTEKSILMDKNSKPLGGKFSFDKENRKKLPSKKEPPLLSDYSPSDSYEELSKIINNHFENHPGDTKDFYYPNTRRQALHLLNDFFKNRFEDFGDYEDAITPKSDFVYHSVLSACINIGFLTPQEILDQATEIYQNNKKKLNSVEGFIRQIMGWREFIRGIYQNYSEKEESSNFFNHQRKLSSHWYKGNTGILPLDDAIQKVIRLSYNHHIERLMILGNTMLLCEIDPQEVHRWFMEHYMDSSDWVMGPNVYGMSQFSDGGLFATKPYICGSNYILKMSDYKKDDWCETMDGLYWRFIDKKKKFFKKNHRMSMMVNICEKMDKEKKKRLFKKAEDFIEKISR